MAGSVKPPFVFIQIDVLSGAQLDKAGSLYKETPYLDASRNSSVIKLAY